jgi:moderate conductance mechanosensitive channel
MANEIREILLWLRTAGLRLVLIGAGSILLIHLFRMLGARIVALASSGEGPTVSEREKRVRTLASLIRTVGTAVVVALAVPMALREFGLDITPLLAGAGVAGLAVGFGAQSLIKDVIAGFLILLEDQFHVGDVIQAAGVSGQVERVTFRLTIVRDLNGTVHFIPNGEIKVVSNLTKEWSRVVLEIGIPYAEDLDRVLGLLAAAGRELREDAVMGKLLLEAPQVLGVEALTETQVTIRVLARTLPLKQWDVARELRRRIKLRFDQAGIAPPYPARVILTPGPPAAG